MGIARVAIGAFFLFLVAAGIYVFSIGGSGGGNFEDVSLDVALNDEISEDIVEDGSGSCMGVGPPPDHFTVTLQGTVNDAWSGRYVSSDTYEIVTRIGGETDRSNTTVVDGGSKQIHKTMFIPDDESVAPGEETTVTVSLEKDGESVDSVQRTVTVKERNMNLDCEETPSIP